MEHGTRNSYTTHGCRCTACRAANADYQRERYQTRADVREQVQAYQEQRRREVGVLPRQPASPEILRERRRLRDRASRMEETIEQREERRAARRLQVAQASDEERRHRLELQRARNLAFRARKTNTYRQAA